MGSGRLETAILDRDGTVIFDRHYLSDPAQVELLPGAVEGLKALLNAGLGLVIITNQSGVGRGYFTMDEVKAVNSELERQLKQHGIYFDGIFSCPHTPEDGCKCRKPMPGMVIEAAGQLDFDPVKCVMIGDKISDLETGRAVGALTVLVRTGKGASEEPKLEGQADIVADNLSQAAAKILERLAGN